jgi:hypothetical protein
MKRLKSFVINATLALIVLFTFHIMTSGMLKIATIGVTAISKIGREAEK